MFHFLALLPVCQIIEDFLEVEIFGIFLTPLRIWFLVGLLISVKYLHPKPLLQFIESSKVHSAFFIFCIFNLFSTFQPATATSTAIFYFGMWLSVIAVSIRFNTNQANSLIEIPKVVTLLKVVFWMNISASSLQVIFRDHIFYRLGSLGSISESHLKYPIADTTPYANFVTGLHIERLFLCEFLLIGLVIYLFSNHNLIFKLLITLWVSLIIVATGSFTGLAAFLLLVSIYIIRIFSGLMRWCLIFFIPFFLVILSVQINSKDSKDLLEKIYGSKKAASITTEYRSNNWRFVSSEYLIEKLSFDHHLIGGNGFRANEYVLRDVWIAYNQSKHLIDYVEAKPQSVHNMLSVLYDQGLIAFISLITMLFFLIKYTLSSNSDPEKILYNKLFQCFLILTSLRFLFYYHSSPRFSLILCIVFFSYLKQKDSKNTTI